MGELLTLRLIRNPGAAFSQGEGFTWVFAVAAVLVLGFVGVRLVPRLGHVGWAVALGLLVAGVTGNLVDRIFRAPGPFRGHVVDFLQLPHWPIFNVADMCITSRGGPDRRPVPAQERRHRRAPTRRRGPARQPKSSTAPPAGPATA